MKRYKSYKRKINDTFYLPVFREVIDPGLFVYNPYILFYKKTKSNIIPDPCRYPKDFLIYNVHKDRF